LEFFLLFEGLVDASNSGSLTLETMQNVALETMSDGLVTIRAPVPSDIPLIIAARDDEHRRWLGPGSNHPGPSTCVVVEGETVGWVDYDHDREHDWLNGDEVNLGYFIFPGHRGKGFAARAVELLLAHLAAATPYRTASALIDSQNVRSLAVARRCGFELVGKLEGGKLYFRRYLSWGSADLLQSDAAAKQRRTKKTRG